MARAVADTEDKLTCMAAGTEEVSVHIREFKQGTHKNSHNAHSSTVPRSQRVASCKGG